MPSTGTARRRASRLAEGERLIRVITLTVQPMTPENFSSYGEIIGERGEVHIDLDGGSAAVVAQTVESRPLGFDFLGRHLNTDQIFVPLGGAPSIVAVAPPSPANSQMPDIERMAAFLADGSFAFKLRRGTWHTSAFPLGERATFIVVDRDGTLETDYDLRDLKTSLGVSVEILYDGR